MVRSFLSLLLRCVPLIACALLAPTSASAQSGADRGEWQILEARYGTSQRNVDVTQRLREIARRDTSFRVSNDLFGTDPDPGVVKTLRIYARNPAGATRTFEYGEQQFVSGAMFTAWSGGNWGQGGWGGGWGDSGGSQGGGDGGQWQIQQARYGTSQRNVDVTQRLRDLARGDNFFRVDNATMGGDPHEGAVKTLRIYARNASGATRTFEYGEEQFVNGAIFTAWSGGNWGQGGGDGGWGQYPGGGVAYGGVSVVTAQYGEGRDRIDVTNRLRSMVRNGRLNTRVNNDSMGSDPAPGRPKILWVTYYVGGQGQKQTKVYEGQELVLP